MTQLAHTLLQGKKCGGVNAPVRPSLAYHISFVISILMLSRAMISLRSATAHPGIEHAVKDCAMTLFLPSPIIFPLNRASSVFQAPKASIYRASGGYVARCLCRMHTYLRTVANNLNQDVNPV